MITKEELEEWKTYQAKQKNKISKKTEGKTFTYWELLLLVLLTSICSGFAVAFNAAVIGVTGILLFFCMWVSKK